MGDVIVYTMEELERTIQNLEDRLQALASDHQISDVGDYHDMCSEREYLVQGKQRLKHHQDELSKAIYRSPTIVNIKSKSFSGSHVVGSYDLGLEDGFNLLKDHLKKIKPDGNWDEVCGISVKEMLNK